MTPKAPLLAAQIEEEYLKLNDTHQITPQEFIVLQSIIALLDESASSFASIIQVANRLGTSREAAKRSMLSLALKGILARAPGGFTLSETST